MKTLKQRKRSPKSDLAWWYNSKLGCISRCQSYVGYLNRSFIIDNHAFSVIYKQLEEAKEFLKVEYECKKEHL